MVSVYTNILTAMVLLPMYLNVYRHDLHLCVCVCMYVCTCVCVCVCVYVCVLLKYGDSDNTDTHTQTQYEKIQLRSTHSSKSKKSMSCENCDGYVSSNVVHNAAAVLLDPIHSCHQCSRIAVQYIYIIIHVRIYMHKHMQIVVNTM